MKTFISKLLAAVIIGFAAFAVLYYIFSMSREESTNGAISAAIAGLVVEYLRPYIKRLVNKKNS